MNARQRLLLAAAAACVAVAGYVAWRLADRGAATDEADPAGAIVGTYQLDREHYRRRLLEVAEAWVASNADGLPDVAQARLLARERDKAKTSAAQMDVSLELRGDGTFRLRQASDRIESVGTGTWVLDENAVTLTTTALEGTGEDEPPAPLTMRVARAALIVQPSPGVPFEHRLVRTDA